mmetsp:Transcript_30043/g.84641  ORF Transcript_30043/g.84641 Transcript_30043/m.84641 type:complete len:245 (-) Transcript_30043:1073-1807(-)
MRQRRDIASSGQQPRRRITTWASSRPRAGRRSATKPSPIFSSCSPFRTCCRDSEMVTESPRLNFSRSKVVEGGRARAPISLPGSSQPMIVTFFGSRRPKTPVQGRPSRHQPRRWSSISGRRCVRRLICRSSSMCSRCMSMQKWPKYSAAATLLSCVTRRPFSRWPSIFAMACCASFLRELPLSSPTLLGSTMRMGSGSFARSRTMNQPPVGGPFVSRAFQPRSSPPQLFRENHQPFLTPFGSRR